MWNGTQSQIIEVNFSKGIDGVSNITDIPDGYCIDVVNQDLSKPGRSVKRPGYHVWGCPLPVRTRNLTVGATREVTLDAIPLLTVRLNLYANTGANATDYGRAEVLQTDDSQSTLYATIDTTFRTHDFTITTDTVFEFTDYTGVKHLVCPVAVFDDNTFIFPLYVWSWFNNPLPALSDAVAQQMNVRICSGFSFPKIVEGEIDNLEVTSTAANTVNMTVSDADIRDKLRVGSQILFETVLLQPDPTNPGGLRPLTGYVSAVVNEEVTVKVENSSLLIVGRYDTNYLTIRYMTGKSYWYKSEDKSFVSSGPTYVGVTNIIAMTGSSALSLGVVQDLDTVPGAGSYNEVGFLYGTGVDVGYLNFVNKYFDVSTNRDRIVTAYDGNIFKEDDFPIVSLPVIPSLRYMGASTTVNIHPTNRTFTISLPLAHLVYKKDDVVEVSYAVNTANDLVTESFVVDSVAIDSLVLASNGEQVLVLRRGTKFVLTRTSTIIYIAADVSHVPLFAGMTIQLNELNSQKRWYVVKEVVVDTTSPVVGDKYLVLEDEIQWSSDDVLYVMPYFVPIFQPSTYLPLTPAYVNKSQLQLSAVPVDRSVYVAAGFNGIWRFNGAEVVNMRMPMPPPGLQRSVIGGGGFLRVDESSDGVSELGRDYRFLVTYSYSELVNGVFKEYESGLNPVGTYESVSVAADNGRQGSRLIELQVPSIPDGIGLPARSMRINIYRKLDGDVTGDIVDQPYLLELSLANNPDVPFLTALVGFEPPLTFNAEQRKTLYYSLGAPEDTEAARPVDDPPLVSLLMTHENRLFAANGYRQPYVKFVCSEVFHESDNFFKAHAQLSLVPVFSDDTTYRFFTAPVGMTTVSASNGGGALGRSFQVFRTPYYEINTVTLVDNSHLFVVTAFAVTADQKYLLRFSRGEKEATSPSTEQSYYENFGFESQVFIGTSTANTVSASKKYKAKDTLGAVITPTEKALVFVRDRELSAITPTNGLQIGSNDESGSLTSPSFTLFITEAALSIALNSFLIFHGIGTLGQVKDTDGRVQNFDKDLVFEVTARANASNVSTYTLRPVFRKRRADNTAGEWVTFSLIAGYPVGNTPTSVIHGNMTIYILTGSTEYALSGFTLSPTTFDVVVAAGGVGSPPALPATAGSVYQIQGLPAKLPEPEGIDFNGRHELIALAGLTATFRLPSLPDTARGILTVDTSAFSAKGRIAAASTIVTTGAGYVEVWLQSQVLTVTARAGQWVYMICRGANPDNYVLQLTGWFKIVELYNGANWVTTLGAPSNLTRIRLEFNGTLDYDLITGISSTRMVIPNSTSASELLIPVPVPTKRGVTDDDITGTCYNPVDGYTALERVVKRFTHAINMVLYQYGYAYWGGNAYGRIDGEIPVNGFIFYPHLYPINRYARVFDTVDISTLDVEPRWELRGEDDVWSIEGDTSYESTGVSNPLTVITAKEYYPSKFWYTDAPGTETRTLTRAFRVLSNDQIASEDGEEIVAAVSFQTYLLMFKRNSIWRLRFAGGISPVKERTQSTVGAESQRNVVSTDRGVFFLHSSGFYLSDGGETRPVMQTSRHFNTLAVQNRALFSMTAGHHNPLSKIVYMGVPFSDEETRTTDKVEGQFVFNYSLQEVTLYSVQQGWSRNTNIPATDWTRILDGDYFSSTKGKVYRIRPETGSSRYRDEETAISGSLVTRFANADTEIQPKFFKNAFFQFGTETSASMDVRVSWDYLRDSQLLQTIPIIADGYGLAPFGTSFYGAEKWAIPVRRTMRPNRVPSVSFAIENAEIDVAGEVFGVFLELDRASTSIVPQTSKL